jgi:hypothetical protein
MTLQIEHILTQEQIEFILNLPEVLQAREKLGTNTGALYFTVELTQEIKDAIKANIGIDLTSVSQIPMRWIRGDTWAHIDRGTNPFTQTYLMYLNDSDGQLSIDGTSFPITQNTAFVFNEGVQHETINTGSTPRLLFGPMSEQGLPVGSPISYYNNFVDASTGANPIAYGDGTPPYQVGLIVYGSLNGITSWRLAPNSTATDSQVIVYTNGTILNSDGTYYFYPAAPCFLEGSKVLCLVDEKEEWTTIENVKKGMLVKTSLYGFKKVEIVGKGSIHNSGTSERSENRLYVCKKEKYPVLTEDLILTGDHSLLVDNLTEKQRDEIKRTSGDIFITDKKYRLMAWLDDRAEPWQSEGTFNIWHLALENADDGMNYGIYANGGLLVETCSLRFMRTKSNMVLQE